MKKLSKKTEVVWKAIYTAVFGWLGYEVMNAMVSYRHNMETIEDSLNDIYGRLGDGSEKKDE